MKDPEVLFHVVTDDGKIDMLARWLEPIHGTLSLFHMLHIETELASLVGVSTNRNAEGKIVVRVKRDDGWVTTVVVGKGKHVKYFPDLCCFIHSTWRKTRLHQMESWLELETI